MPSKRVILVLFAMVLACVGLAGCALQSGRYDTVADTPASCVDRQSRGHRALVDAHVHFLPFGGPTIDFERMANHIHRAGVRYATVFGIGQTLPIDSDCHYYLDCPGEPVTPTLRNDFLNATEFVRTRPHRLHLTLSMTFADLAKPESVLRGMRVLDDEFPDVFGAMGEVNLVKQALFDNHHEPVPIEIIPDWAPFMEVLRERGMPMFIHSDLGSDHEPLKYKAWMDEVLSRYPDNKIVWMHLGLSRELGRIDPELHIGVMREWLDAYPKLMMDLSWRVVAESIFDTDDKRGRYLPFLEAYSDRFLPGTDIVAVGSSTRAHYEAELKETSGIFRYLSDEAFANIALGHNYLRALDLDHEPLRLCAN